MIVLISGPYVYLYNISVIRTVAYQMTHQSLV